MPLPGGQPLCGPCCLPPACLPGLSAAGKGQIGVNLLRDLNAQTSAPALQLSPLPQLLPRGPVPAIRPVGQRLPLRAPHWGSQGPGLHEVRRGSGPPAPPPRGPGETGQERGASLPPSASPPTPIAAGETLERRSQTLSPSLSLQALPADRPSQGKVSNARPLGSQT